MSIPFPDILYEDNHIIAINKCVSDIVQKDSTGDTALDEIVKEYIRVTRNKPGNVYLGVTHRLDRPTSGAVLFARTSKALSRLNKMFRDKEIKKTYLAVVVNRPDDLMATLEHYIVRKREQNKSYCHDQAVNDSKLARLSYQVVSQSGRYTLLEINLETGRHHQIRSQLAKIACPIVGDIKYGYPKALANKGILLHARKIEFIHPVSGEEIGIIAKLPDDEIWNKFKLTDN